MCYEREGTLSLKDRATLLLRKKTLDFNGSEAFCLQVFTCSPQPHTFQFDIHSVHKKVQECQRK